ncbi:AFG1-like ATPase [Xylariaceae sp. FL0594]|nr:AFG1-like ATPase [Xylariaceae sp. FL0594]
MRRGAASYRACCIKHSSGTMRRHMSFVTITDPLVKYQSLLATGLCSPDPAQHRLALHLQKVYHRLKDYSPAVEYSARLREISSTLNKQREKDSSRSLASDTHPIRRNPLFARFFARTQGRDTLALTRVLEGYEEAIHIDSPRGLFLSGEVGTGKSMLLDLLAEGVPTSRKKRWHFNTFMLYTISQLERHRKAHTMAAGDEDHQYSLLWLAKELVERSPILFLDEFQLPDRAASKILSNLFTTFFQLGGVLIASSNRMPEELERATGFEYVAPTTGGLISQALGFGKTRGRGELYGSSSDFASFLEVLKARCEFWQMDGARDWRRRDTNVLSDDTIKITGLEGVLPRARVGLESENSISKAEGEPTSTIARPKEYYYSHDPEHDAAWQEMLESHHMHELASWKAATLTVYGRTITIPRQRDGVVLWDFEDLVSSFGPADYITMASTYHTFIIDNVPVLVLQKKNEARRLITLLDALYEARCKLIIRAAVGPDDLFFPDAQQQQQHSRAQNANTKEEHEQTVEQLDADVLHSETIAEAYQDQISPFRPNISSYDAKFSAVSDSEESGSDFGGSEGGRSSPKVDFSNTGAFTGEDERFAYKRAASRLWEMCGERWHARQGDDWWQPLPVEARHWEGRPASRPRPSTPDEKKVPGDVTMGFSVELDEPAGLQRLRVQSLRKSFQEEEEK